MKKWQLTSTYSGGDISRDITHARIERIVVDHERNVIHGYASYGSDDDGVFSISPFIPAGNDTYLPGVLEEEGELREAWESFQNKLFEAANKAGKLPSGKSV